MEKGKMRRVQRFLRTVGEKAKEVLTHKSKGYNDMVMMASAIISMVIVAVIGGYFLEKLLNALNLEYLKYPLLVLVAIGIIVGVVITCLLRGFGVAEGSEEK